MQSHQSLGDRNQFSIAIANAGQVSMGVNDATKLLHMRSGTPGTLTAIQVALVEPVACPLGLRQVTISNPERS